MKSARISYKVFTRTIIRFFENLLNINFLSYDVKTVDGNFIGKPARLSVKKHETTGRSLRYSSDMCYVRSTDSVFQSFQCSVCKTFFQQQTHFGADFNRMP